MFLSIVKVDLGNAAGVKETFPKVADTNFNGSKASCDKGKTASPTSTPTQTTTLMGEASEASEEVFGSKQRPRGFWVS